MGNITNKKDWVPCVLCKKLTSPNGKNWDGWQAICSKKCYDIYVNDSFIDPKFDPAVFYKKLLKKPKEEVEGVPSKEEELKYLQMAFKMINIGWAFGIYNGRYTTQDWVNAGEVLKYLIKEKSND